MLVAAWIPRFRGPSPSELDFVVFFSPTTAPERGYPADKFPWRDPYPYMAVKRNPLRDKGSPALAQPYPGLGQRYLFELKWLVYQQLAARREATLIFPIQPSGDWGPFAYASGLARLIAEITHFMRRTARTDGLQSDREQDQAARPRYRVSRPGIHLPLPQRRQNILKPRRIILSGFSAGVGPIVGMLGTSSGQKMDDGRFENGHDRFGADVTPFLDAWMEVWDHDAPSEVRAMLEQAGPGWMNRNSRRMLRCYQSQFTSTPRNWIHTTPLAQFAPGSVKPPVSAAGVVADERHADDRCSLVYFDIGFLNHSASAHRVAPVFWKWTESDPNDPKKMIVRGVADEHQAVPMVTFGHAALLSGLKKTE